MMISGIRLKVTHSSAELLEKVKSQSGICECDYRIIKKAIDARRGDVCYVYTVEAVKKGESFKTSPRLQIPRAQFEQCPVIAGAGPCGLMCAYILAKAGARPIILERGKSADRRVRDIENFFINGILNESSNVQFGEGGAGTFSDGKLTTRINDPLCREVLEIFNECGAPDEILYLAKPHLGTDRLIKIVSRLRTRITEMGGEVHFEEKLCGIDIKSNRIRAAVSLNGEYKTDTVVLAVGHSARDTFVYLENSKIPMQSKAFSVGVRIEHKRALIDSAQYGKYSEILPAADYNLSYPTEKGRGVYTFCMCPGGQVVAAASQKGGVVTNGMSLYARDGQNSNSALLVGVTEKDFGGGVLDGMYFQRALEEKAFELGGRNYRAPCQQLVDFTARRMSVSIGGITPTYRPGVTPCDLHKLLPEFITDAMHEAIPVFGRRLKGFDTDALLTAPETRSSSPVRILRDSSMQSSISGLYPAGEGAGYAGGIMSAAVDGIKCALAVINNHSK